MTGASSPGLGQRPQRMDQATAGHPDLAPPQHRHGHLGHLQHLRQSIPRTQRSQHYPPPIPPGRRRQGRTDHGARQVSHHSSTSAVASGTARSLSSPIGPGADAWLFTGPTGAPLTRTSAPHHWTRARETAEAAQPIPSRSTETGSGPARRGSRRPDSPTGGTSWDPRTYEKRAAPAKDRDAGATTSVTGSCYGRWLTTRWAPSKAPTAGEAFHSPCPPAGASRRGGWARGSGSAGR